MAKQVVLKEFECLQCKSEEKNNYIKKESFEGIEKFVLENETMQYLKITTNKRYGKVLQAQNYVGVIQTKDGTTIEILPKIADDDNMDRSKEILFKMLKTLKKSPFKNVSMAHLKSAHLPLLEIFISMFLEELSKLVQRGIKSDYVQKEENLKFLKGKLKVGEQIKHNSIHKERFFVQYEEFSSNRVENRLIKTTLEYLYKKSQSNKNQQRIREFLFVFDEIGVSHTIKTDFEKVSLNRHMKDYEKVLLWCKTFLLEKSFSPYKGDDVAFALLFDMNVLFESYVGDHLKKRSLDVSLQDKGKYLVESHNKFALRPDIVVTRKRNIFIADTKWKKVTEEKDIAQSDMYQLFAYGKKYNECKHLYLIYPKFSENHPKLHYRYENTLPLKVYYFDLMTKKFHDLIHKG